MVNCPRCQNDEFFDSWYKGSFNFVCEHEAILKTIKDSPLNPPESPKFPLNPDNIKSPKILRDLEKVVATTFSRSLNEEVIHIETQLDICFAKIDDIIYIRDYTYFSKLDLKTNKISQIGSIKGYLDYNPIAIFSDNIITAHDDKIYMFDNKLKYIKGFKLGFEDISELIIWTPPNNKQVLLVFASDAILLFDNNLTYITCIHDDQICGNYYKFALYDNKIYSTHGYTNKNRNRIKCWNLSINDQYNKRKHNRIFELEDDICMNIISNDKFLYVVGKKYLYRFSNEVFKPVLELSDLIYDKGCAIKFPDNVGKSHDISSSSNNIYNSNSISSSSNNISSSSNSISSSSNNISNSNSILSSSNNISSSSNSISSSSNNISNSNSISSSSNNISNSNSISSSSNNISNSNDISSSSNNISNSNDISSSSNNISSSSNDISSSSNNISSSSNDISSSSNYINSGILIYGYDNLCRKSKLIYISDDLRLYNTQFNNHIFDITCLDDKIIIQSYVWTRIYNIIPFLQSMK